jgi:hypothetical protein
MNAGAESENATNRFVRLTGVPFTASDGGLYFVCSGVGDSFPFPQSTYNARMRDPLRIVGERVRIATATEPGIHARRR